MQKMHAMSVLSPWRQCSLPNHMDIGKKTLDLLLWNTQLSHSAEAERAAYAENASAPCSWPLSEDLELGPLAPLPGTPSCAGAT